MTQEELEKIKKERLTQFKKAFDGMVANSKEAYNKSDSKFSSSRSKIYSNKDIEQIVERGNPNERAQLSEYFFTVNGLYKRIILHYATFLTYSWVLVPYLKNKKLKITDKKISQIYYDATDFCTNFQIENKCSLFAKEILVKGAYYGLVQDKGDKVIIQNLPFDFCRSRFKNTDDIDIVEFNMAFFDTIRDEQLRKEILNTYPRFIAKAYDTYKYKNGPKWIFLPAEMGIYFCLFEEKPFFLDLIPLLKDLDDYKAIDKDRNKQSLKRIIVQKVGIDGDKLIFEPEEAEEMHEGVLEMLQNNPDVDVITTYNDIDLLDLSSDDDKKTEIQDIQNLIYESAGLSKELFFSTTEAGLKYSIDNDLAMMMILGQRFAHFFSTLLKYKFENNKIKFKFIILPLSYYNSADYTSRAKELAAFGYSFLTPILSTGLDQTNLPNLKMLENELLHLDEILKPLQSSYTQTGKTQGQPISESKENSPDNADDKKEEEPQQDKKETEEIQDKEADK